MAFFSEIFILIFFTQYSFISSENNICASVSCPYPTQCEHGVCECSDGFVKENCTDTSHMCYCTDSEICRFDNCSCSDGIPFVCLMLPVCSADTNITCKHNGTCVVRNNEPYCICPPSITNTTDCTPNRCDEDPCSVGDCIPRPNNDYDCLCPHGGIGKDCSLNQMCSDNFCADRGTCFVNEYAKCRCMSGFSGLRCEENTTVSECDPFGTASTRLNNITNETECICSTSFKGKTCDSLDCQKDNPCQNGGLCYSDPKATRRFICVCPLGWTGFYCLDDINECEGTPCENNGTCINLNGTFECQCPENITGKHCDNQLMGCLFPDKCMMYANDGTCNADCNNKYCNFDGGDCILDTPNPWDECHEEPGYCKSLAGNDVCNQECNHETCLYDLLDCYQLPSGSCPENCTDTWGDGECQTECNTRVCGFDGSDCQMKPQFMVLGTIVINYISDSPDSYKVIGRVLSSYSGAVFSLEAHSSPVKKTSQFMPLKMSPSQLTELKYTAFFAVHNNENCSLDNMCWNNTKTLSKFSAVFYTKNENLFQSDAATVAIQNIRACVIGYYGANCDLMCPVDCNISMECDLKTGQCLHGCKEGYWGNHCERSCNKNCQLGCEQSDGNCTDGICNIGYQGARCEDSCTDGNYGMMCMYNCSENCKKYTCDNVNGNCTCIIGFEGDTCEKVCENGTYGENCVKQCGSCINDEPCDPIDGNCIDQCKPGFMRPKCKSCLKDRYGPDCSKTCPSNCEKGVCDPKTGQCKTCKAGFKGKMCAEATKSSSKQEAADNSTIIAVIIVLVVLIVVGGCLAFILWKRSKNDGSYLMNEKGPDATPLKEIKDKTGSESTTEPLVAATPTDKNFTDAKLVIESEGIDLDKDKEEEIIQKTEVTRSSKASDYRSSKSSKSSEHRSSKASDFRPESIHANGPGGVYVGDHSKPQTDTASNSPESSAHNTSSDSNKLSADEASNVQETTEHEGNLKESGQEKDEETTQHKDPENNDSDPVTTVNDNGVINTDKL